jgi:CRP-like cAMP-binding protein
MLPPRVYAQLQKHLQPVELGVAEYLQIPDKPLRYVYFPTGLVAVLVCRADQRPPFAVGLVGSEGLIGLPVFLGSYTAHWGAQVHLAGTALRLPAEELRQLCQEEGPLSAQLRIYTDTLLAQVIQSAACGRFHLLPARLARWLLMTDDRSDAETFSLTHQALAELLGVRREAVSNAAGVLQRQHLIGYRRGLLRIYDRAGLEAIVCDCYRYPDTGISEPIQKPSD